MLAGGDNVAIHQAGDQRRQTPRGDGDHHLIEQRESRFSAALTKYGPTLEVPGDGDQIPVPAALSDTGRLLGEGFGCGVVVFAQTPEDARQQQIAALGAVAAPEVNNLS